MGLFFLHLHIVVINNLKSGIGCSGWVDPKVGLSDFDVVCTMFLFFTQIFLNCSTVLDCIVCYHFERIIWSCYSVGMMETLMFPVLFLAVCIEAPREE